MPRMKPESLPAQCDSRTTFFGKGWRHLTLAFFVFAATAVQAAPVNVYRGTLGGSAVVMELGQANADGVREGRYFYIRHGVDIPLKGTLNALAEALPLNDGWRRSQGDTPLFVSEQQRSVQWRLQIQGEALSGDWVDGIQGKKLPLVLARIGQYDPEKIAPKGVEAVTLAIVQGAGSGISQNVAISAQTTLYDYLKVGEQKLDQGKEVVINPTLAWRPVRDARTKLWYPRLTRHPDAKILSQTNEALQQRHWAMNLEALGCRSSIYTSVGPEAGTLANLDDESIKVSYLSSSVMSVVESGSSGCGGAHPNNHFDPYVLDLLKGGYLDFIKLFKGAKYADYSVQYSPQMMAFIKKATARAPDPDDKECTDLLPQYLATMFNSPDKVSFVISGIGHALGVCLGSGVEIRFNDLKPFIKPGAEAYFKP